MELQNLHQQHAHCESGVTTNLLQHYGVNISEPMAFGIGGGIFFAHLPFVKVGGIPGTTFRVWPGLIFKRITKKLGIETHVQTFKDKIQAQVVLDQTLAKGIPVGMIAGVYYLNYLPEAFRFHFNAHNLVIYGKENNQYLVSDPILKEITTISPEDLERARFAKGFPEPKGKMYYIKNTPEKIDLAYGVRTGIKHSCFMMLSPPLPWFGLNAVDLLAKKIANYPHKLTPRQCSLYLGNIIRMQEEIGTGGGGFRFLYAAFLQESAQLLGRDDLGKLSAQCTTIGDQWRNFAYNAARLCKDRNTDRVSYADLSRQLKEIGVKERELFKELKGLKW